MIGKAPIASTDPTDAPSPQDPAMPLADIHTRAAILRAIAEYDALG